jgi:hypothetical protein
MTDDTVLEEAMDNLKEAGQRIRATQSLMRSQGMTDGENHRDFLTRLSTALAMTEAAYLEARRRRDLQLAGARLGGAREEARGSVPTTYEGGT